MKKEIALVLLAPALAAAQVVIAPIENREPNSSVRAKLNAAIALTQTNQSQVGTLRHERLPYRGAITNHIDLSHDGINDMLTLLHTEPVNQLDGPGRGPPGYRIVFGVRGFYIDRVNRLRLANGYFKTTPQLAIQNNSVRILGIDVEDFVRPNVAAPSLTLDRSIYSWGEIGTTNAIPTNPRVSQNIIATGTYSTSGSILSDGSVFLLPTQYFSSRRFRNGIAAYYIGAHSDQNGTSADIRIQTALGTAVGTVGVPYHGPCYLVINASESLPGSTPGLTITNLTVVSYSDGVAAAELKEASNLRIIDAPVHDDDVARKREVDAALAAAKKEAAARLDDYAADTSKTLRGTQLRLNASWQAKVSGSGHVVLSAGQIAGDGQLVGATNYFVLAQNDREMLRFQSDVAGLFINGFTINPVPNGYQATLLVATNGVRSAPMAEIATDLATGEWSTPSIYISNSYPSAEGSNYVLRFDVPEDAEVRFFRAVQAVGESRASFSTAVVSVPDARSADHALNRRTADARYAPAYQTVSSINFGSGTLPFQTVPLIVGTYGHPTTGPTAARLSAAPAGTIYITADAPEKGWIKARNSWKPLF